MTRSYQLDRVPVAGGEYTVARWGDPAAGAVLLLHGITASHKSWRPVVDRLTFPGLLLAPDLRGRGGSGKLPGPFGLAAHVRDLLATLDHYRVERPLVVGHSRGAYLALEFAATARDRAAALVLVDGGLALPMPPGLDPQVGLAAVLGPALARLERTFESREAYREFWRVHPSFQDPGAWSEYVEDYVDYDLEGTPPALRSKVNVEAVRTDGAAPLSSDIATLIDRVRLPMLLLTAPRGLLNQPEPLLPKALVDATRARLPRLQWKEIPDTNHYTITMGSGAAAVAAEIDRLADRLGAG
jgi:pimeloyl-ACP methyl ester carboxylesterase